MRNFILAIVSLLLLALLIFLIWRIIPRNNPPDAVADAFTTPYETAVSDSVITNDSDPDGDTLIVQNTQPQQTTGGTVTLDSSGTFVYTPNNGFIGEDQFTYELCDPENACTTGSATVMVESPLVVAMDDLAETMLNTAVSIAVAANDQGENLSVQSLSAAPSNGTAVVETNPLQILYTPNENYMGSDSFTYAICNAESVCDTAQVTVTIRDFQLNDDQFHTPKNIALQANVRGNDSGTTSINTAPVSPPANGVLALQESGEFNYTPNTDFLGEDTFGYEACNAASMCDTALVSIQVGGPVAEADRATTARNTSISGNVSSNDQGDNLQVNQTPLKATESGGVVLLADGSFTYTPDNDFVGEDTSTYETCDSDSLCAEAVVTITVESIPVSAMHTVVQGEWLLQIARCYGTTVQAILAQNRIRFPDFIYPGQVLFIPNIGSAGPYHGPPCVDYHTVSSGETLEGIAAANNMTGSELARVNGLYANYYTYDVYDFYYGYRTCCGYGYYPRYYQSYTYLRDIYEGQTLVFPNPVPNYMRPGS